ncbi:hypothetical protein AVEN_4406-1 [Araneus ventricosus]|uniref:Uncharacterized protein n=1 Tax=Araneus ventricosus TaxID=182803 RepID=A0A4Y2X2E1_ARAVE|nr:hypothetical protein AVEN_4406-1 [Araneus ventricosus]
MDEKKTFIGDEINVPNKPVDTESETDNSDILSQELDGFNKNKVSPAEVAPELKHICKERKDPDNHLQENKDDILRERTLQVTSEVYSDENAKGIAHRNADKLNNPSVKKANYIKKTVLKHTRGAITKFTGTIKNIKFIRRKGKILKVSRSKSTQQFAKEEKYISQIDKCSKISNEERIFQSKLESVEDTKSGVANIEKAKRKADMLAKLETQSETSSQSKDATRNLCSMQSTFVPVSPYDSVTNSQSSTVRTANEVWSHFIWYMQSSADSLDRIKTDDINKEDIKPSPESGIRSLEDPTKTATEPARQNLEDATKTQTESARQNLEYPVKTASESISQNFKDFAKAVMESSMTQDPGKVMREVSVNRVDNSATVIKNNRRISRQRIVYDENVEYIRGWIIQQIKDREILLKFRIMEGKYSKDIETKMRCIEEATDLQEETDSLFDALDDSEKVVNISKRFKGYPASPTKDSSKSATKNKNGLKWPEGQIKSFSSLFRHMYKSSSSESMNEDVFESIHPRNFKSAFDAYLVSKKKHDSESEISENNAKNCVDEFHLSLVQGRSKVKCKIAHSEIRSLEDYQNYINDLKMAANENLNCLDTLIPQVTSVILPLMSYLSQSRRKIVQIFAFLEEERSDVFPKTSDKNEAFFEEFCKRHFTN